MNAMPGNWDDLRTRLLSGLGMAAMAAAGLVGGGRAWTGLLLLIAAGLAVEWGMLLAGRVADRASGAVTVLLAVCVGGVPLAMAASTPHVAVALPVLGGAGLLAWTRNPLLALGAPYLGAGVLGMFWLRDDPAAGLANTLFVVVVVVGSDVGAYIAGRALGGRKLAPSISPGKTVSGAFGGLVGAMLAGAATAAANGGGGLGAAALLAIAFSVLAQAGDLAESWLKRRVGAKDSSQLIPGHGGLLDRLDALLAVAPVAAALAFTLGRGVVLWQWTLP